MKTVTRQLILKTARSNRNRPIVVTQDDGEPASDLVVAPPTIVERIDVVSLIMAYESGELDDEGTVKLFQHLIDTGAAWTLQGSYGRMAARLIDAGYCIARG